LRNFDASTFNAWFIAFTLGNPKKMAIAEKRFRPEFKVAFDAWRPSNLFSGGANLSCAAEFVVLTDLV
jgi:hypothetical protein